MKWIEITQVDGMPIYINLNRSTLIKFKKYGENHQITIFFDNDGEHIYVKEGEWVKLKSAMEI